MRLRARASSSTRPIAAILSGFALLALGACASRHNAPEIAQGSSTPPLVHAKGSASIEPADHAPPEPPEDGEELAWDFAVGWERRREFPPGVTSIPRSDADYLKLRYAGLADPEFLELIIQSKGKLEDKPILGTGDEFCNVHLGEILRRKKLPRLLLTIEQGLKPEHLRCLENLGGRTIYLSLCPQPKANNYRTCGGEEDLRVLSGASPSLLERVRGIAVGLDTPTSWQRLLGFRHLAYLTVQGPAAARQDPAALSDLCGRSTLIHLDMLDAAEITSERVRVPDSCGLLRQSFDYWYPPEPVRGEACHLRRLFVWNLDERQQASLESACPRLHAIDIVEKRKRIRK